MRHKNKFSKIITARLSTAGLLLTILLVPVVTLAESAYYDLSFLKMSESTAVISALDYHKGMLYAALAEYGPLQDDFAKRGSLVKYDIKTGKTEAFLKHALPYVSSLAVFEDKALISTHKQVESGLTNIWLAELCLIELKTGEVLNKISLKSDCADCYWADIEQVADRRFAVAMPGQNKVYFILVGEDNRLERAGESSYMREVKALYWNDGVLYAAGSTRVDNETRGAIYTVNEKTKTAELFMTVMESRGGFSGLWVSEGFLMATNFYNAKMLDNSLFVFDLSTQKLVAELQDLPMTTARICFSDDTIYAADLAGVDVAVIKLDFKALKRKAQP